MSDENKNKEKQLSGKKREITAPTRNNLNLFIKDGETAEKKLKEWKTILSLKKGLTKDLMLKRREKRDLKFLSELLNSDE